MISVFTAYLLIPLYTLLFVYGTDWFSTNLSVIGSWPEMRDGFVFLGLLLLAYYCGALRRLLRYLPRRRLETGMAGMAAIRLRASGSVSTGRIYTCASAGTKIVSVPNRGARV